MFRADRSEGWPFLSSRCIAIASDSRQQDELNSYNRPPASMALSPGTTLGPYAIVSQLSSGEADPTREGGAW